MRATYDADAMPTNHDRPINVRGHRNFVAGTMHIHLLPTLSTGGGTSKPRALAATTTALATGLAVSFASAHPVLFCSISLAFLLSLLLLLDGRDSDAASHSGRESEGHLRHHPGE